MSDLIILPVITRTDPCGAPLGWLSRLAARVRKIIARLAVAVQQSVLGFTASTKVAFGRSPSETDLRKMPVGSAITRVHTPARPPAPMPWHEDR